MAPFYFFVKKNDEKEDFLPEYQVSFIVYERLQGVPYNMNYKQLLGHAVSIAGTLRNGVW
jgi:hypothetical protein